MNLVRESMAAESIQWVRRGPLRPRPGMRRRPVLVRALRRTLSRSLLGRGVRHLDGVLGAVVAAIAALALAAVWLQPLHDGAAGLPLALAAPAASR